MQATRQQQIVVYFIEEAKEHLNTIEQGLLDLQATMADAERLNELFRAAHSVKGGAAMLGFDSIQHVGHHLEDCFKTLKENPIAVDQQIEDLFLKGFDALKELVEALQSPYGLRQQDAERIVQEVEPAFAELERYLTQGVSAPAAQPTAKVVANLPKLMTAGLKKMLELFKQGDSAATRQQLVALCQRMGQFHSCTEWQQQLQTCQAAIANAKNPFPLLAPLVIRELKQAGDLLIAGKTWDITPGKQLQQVAARGGADAPVSAAPVPAAPVSAAPVSAAPAPPSVKPIPASSKVAQISVPAEPRAAARVLLGAFNKSELIELAEYLMKAIQ